MKKLSLLIEESFFTHLRTPAWIADILKLTTFRRCIRKLYEDHTSIVVDLHVFEDTNTILT
jgi:hypothetical protein